MLREATEITHVQSTGQSPHPTRTTPTSIRVDRTRPFLDELRRAALADLDHPTSPREQYRGSQFTRRCRWCPRSGCRPYPSVAMDKFYPLIEHYGYLIVFFSVMLGCSGVPFPSAAILLPAGALVQQGHLHLGEAVAFGILGAIVGNQI